MKQITFKEFDNLGSFEYLRSVSGKPLVILSLEGWELEFELTINSAGLILDQTNDKQLISHIPGITTGAVLNLFNGGSAGLLVCDIRNGEEWVACYNRVL